MAMPTLETAPVLSTPDAHLFEDPTPAVATPSLPKLSDGQISLTYEIERTVKDIREGQWKRIALQFPDHMLVDAPRVYEALSRSLRSARRAHKGVNDSEHQNGTEELGLAGKLEGASLKEREDPEEKLFILGDTSYGACCVDEVAAEHVDADVVVHYGRSCLSPPSRLAVIHVFTERPLDLDAVVSAFKQTYPEKGQKIILMADIPYSHHIPRLHTRLREEGYTDTHATEIVHNPSSLLPNRTVPVEGADENEALRDYHLFHISDPPTSLLLTLSSRVASTNIYPTDTPSPTATLVSTALSLRRRYALLTRLASVPVFGILINTLSVKNYMHILHHVQRQITAASKKHYTFVVGKVNAAKVANFSEVGGWVVIGCWESSLIESDDFWKPIITPFELGLALQSDDQRVWTGEWRADFQRILESDAPKPETQRVPPNGHHAADATAQRNALADAECDSEDESAPPEFDLRTGRYVSHSRPMRAQASKPAATVGVRGVVGTSTVLAKRANGDLAQIGGVVSPGAEFLRSNRTWQGLGSDYRRKTDENPLVHGNAATMEEGRSGIARGYVVGDGDRH